MAKNDLSSATAKVTLVVEVPAGSSWGADVSLDQIYRQVSEETRNHLERIFREAKTGVRILSSTVTAVAAVKERHP